MNKNKLRKQIEKYYWSHGQCIIVDSYEVFENNDNDCVFDIHLVNEDETFLFSIMNYNGFNDIEIVGKNHFNNPDCKFIRTWDGVKASCQPLYFNDTIALKTFKSITKEDIVNATKYSVHRILGLGCLFNFKFAEDKDEKI